MQRTKRYIVAILSMLAIILYPCLFMYFQNIGEGYFIEIFEAIGFFLLLAILIGVISYVILRDFITTVFFSEMAMLVLMNFNTMLGLIRKVFPGTKKVYLFMIVAIIGLVLLWFLKKKRMDIFPILKIFGIVFLSLILFNFVMSFPSLIKKVTANKNVATSEEIVNQKFIKEKPNVYYLIFDEYAGFECLGRYYEYDNAEVETFLKDEGFNISYKSYNTESLWTSTLIPNLINMSYVATDEEYSIDNFAKTERSLMYQMFWNNGYAINLVNHIDQLETAGCNLLNPGKKSETLSTYILENSIWDEMNDVKQWILYNIKGVETDYGIVLRNTMHITETCAEKVHKLKPTLTVSYICSPHTYFVLDKDGNRIPTEVDTDWKNKSVYLGQLEYTSKCMINTVKNIKKEDPNALIIIQSDHGARYPYWMVEYYGEPEYDEVLERPYMQNIFNCVYYQGKVIDIEGLSGINTLRKVYNEVLGTELKMLEVK